LLTGGGSGGHITPLLAVAASLKSLDKDLQVIYAGQVGDRFAQVAETSDFIDRVVYVRAGKFRRFHNEGLKQFFNVKVIVWNLRDAFFILIGLVQSIVLLRKLKPDVVFSRGGYVSVPIALGAKFNQVAYITHDSDPVLSLTNKIIGPWAAINAVALAAELYPYPKHKIVTTGIPVSNDFKYVTPSLKDTYRQAINLSLKARVLFVVGGGLGSVSINKAILDCAPALLKKYQNLYIIHVAGETNQKTLEAEYADKLEPSLLKRVKVLGFVNDIYKYSGAAEVIVSRGGATNLAEFAIQAKPVIIVPSPFLTGGHQVKNANYLKKKQAAIIVNEPDIKELKVNIVKLLDSPELCSNLANNLHQLATDNAAQKIARLILDLGEKHEAKQ
jgi:UDP-N-acetylglucosamine--N-acetylmuramyl-(pentapeptide) pyrophosphoryl-undecaprenol N-acetylglucosamine transferase